jgi:hypothetical protein
VSASGYLLLQVKEIPLGHRTIDAGREQPSNCSTPASPPPHKRRDPGFGVPLYCLHPHKTPIRSLKSQPEEDNRGPAGGGGRGKRTSWWCQPTEPGETSQSSREPSSRAAATGEEKGEVASATTGEGDHETAPPPQRWTRSFSMGQLPDAEVAAAI